MKKYLFIFILSALLFAHGSQAIPPIPTPSASETRTGTVELATTSEAATGTDTSRAVTPAGLAAGIAGISGIGANETYGSGWNADTGAPEKDDVYDYLHLLDTNDDGDIDTIDATYWATKQNLLTDEASLYTVLSDVTQFYEAGDAIDGGIIGGVTPAAGTFTAVTVGSNTAGGNETVNATLGSELITWTDAGWNEDGAWTFAGGVLTHVTGNTTAVTGTVTGALTVGGTYAVNFVGTGGGATASYTLGGVTGTTIAASGAINFTDYITATADSELVITPANTCTVALTLVSVKALTDATGDLTVDGNLTVRSPAYFKGSILNGFLSNTIPSYSFANDTTTGFVGYGSGSAAFLSAASAKVGFVNTGLTLPAIAVLGWGAFGSVLSYDVSLARTAVGSVGVTQQNITAGTATGLEVLDVGSLNHQKYMARATFDDFTDTDTTKGIVIAILPAKTKILDIRADTTAKYTGGTINAVTLEVGVTAEGSAVIIEPIDVFANPIVAGDAEVELGTSMILAGRVQGGYMPSWTGTTAIYATLDSTAGNLNALTTGSTTFYIETERY